MGSSSSTDCRICHGAGFVHPMANGKPEYGKTTPCQCIKVELEQKKREWLLKSCDFPPFADTMTFDRFKVFPDVKLAYDTARNMAANPGKLRWLALVGWNGNGKTHLAISVCRAWLDAGIPARYTLISLLLDELREGFGKEGDYSYEERFRYYCKVPLLLLDDYGMESKTDWVQEKLDTIVDYRLMNNLSLIVTSNKSLDEMPPRIRSRLMRHPQGTIVTILAGEYSMRGKK